MSHTGIDPQLARETWPQTTQHDTETKASVKKVSLVDRVLSIVRRKPEPGEPTSIKITKNGYYGKPGNQMYLQDEDLIREITGFSKEDEAAITATQTPQVDASPNSFTLSEEEQTGLRLDMQRTIAEFCGYKYYPKLLEGDVYGWKRFPEATAYSVTNKLMGDEHAYLCGTDAGLQFDTSAWFQDLVFHKLKELGYPIHTHNIWEQGKGMSWFMSIGGGSDMCVSGTEKSLKEIAFKCFYLFALKWKFKHAD